MHSTFLSTYFINIIITVCFAFLSGDVISSYSVRIPSSVRFIYPTWALQVISGFLGRHLSPGWLIDSSDPKEVGLSNIFVGLKRGCEVVKIAYGQKAKDGLVSHDLRHCFATYARKAWIPKNLIMDIMGHSQGGGRRTRIRPARFRRPTAASHSRHEPMLRISAIEFFLF
jgi:integrase